MSNSIKIDLYKNIKEALSGIYEKNSTTKRLFKYIGHYESPETENLNQFAYRTPAAFISLDTIDWNITQFDYPERNTTRQQKGLIQFSTHLFIHDLRTDEESYIQHLEIIDQAYRAILGLRATTDIEGHFSSIRRISEQDDFLFKNLRHWITTFETFVQEPGLNAGKVDAQPVEFKIIPEQ